MPPITSITKRAWIWSAGVTIVSGLVSGLSCWGLETTFKQGLVITIGFISRDLYKFIQDNPITAISDLDTNPRQFVKTDVSVKTEITGDGKPPEEKTYEGK